MKKELKKLTLNRETLGGLQEGALKHVAGGLPEPTYKCTETC